MATVVAVSNNPASPFYNANAPNLTGQVGQLLTILDALLVNSFTGYTAPGWTKPFANSGNLGCYKQGTGSNGFCLAVNDNGPGAAGAKEARVCGFTSMSSVSAGSGQFPTGAQSSIGTGQLVIRKSSAASSATVYYTFVGDPTCFYLFIESGDFAAPIAALGFMFGDIFTYGSSDTSNTMIIGRTVENTTAFAQSASPSQIEPFGALNNFSSSVVSTLANTIPGQFIAASFTNVGGSVPVGKHTDLYKMGGNNSSTFSSQMGCCGQYLSNLTLTIFPDNFNYPNGPDQGLYQAPVWVHHNGSVRGYLKGLWCPLQHVPLNHNDTFSGTGNLSGKSFLCQALLGAIPSVGSNGGYSECFIETTSGGWT